MSARAWFSVLALTAFFGVVVGWSARAVTMYDREQSARTGALESRINRNNIEAETMIDAARARIARENNNTPPLKIRGGRTQIEGLKERLK